MKKREKQEAPKPTEDNAQIKRFREAAREAGVDPDADIDEVMRRLADQKRPEPKAKRRP